MYNTDIMSENVDAIAPKLANWGVMARACAAQLVSVMGEHIFLATALPLWAFDRTGSTRGVGIALVAATAPALLSLHAGAWTSRHSTRSVLLGCGVMRLLLTALLLITRGETSNFYPTLACVFAIVTVDSFFMPALKSALPEWVPGPQLIRANSFMESTDIPAQIFCPPLAVVLYMKWGLAGAVWAQVLAYGIALSMLASTPFPWTSRSADASEQRLSERVRHILRIAWQSVLVRRTLIAWTIAMVTAGVAEVIVLPFIRTELHQPESVFGLFGALIGLGMGIGAAISAIWEDRFSDTGLLAAAMAIATLALAVLANGSNLVVCAGAVVMIGVGLVLVHVAATTIMQSELPEDIRAGMLGLIHSIEAAGLLVGLCFGGEFAMRLGIRATLDGGAALLVVATVLAVSSTRRRGR